MRGFSQLFLFPGHLGHKLTIMEQPPTLARAIFRLIQTQNQTWWNRTIKGISSTSNTTYDAEYRMAISLYQTLITKLPKGSWHREWRKALRRAKQELPRLPQSVVDTVMVDIRKVQPTDIKENCGIPSSPPLLYPSLNQSTSSLVETSPSFNRSSNTTETQVTANSVMDRTNSIRETWSSSNSTLINPQLEENSQGLINLHSSKESFLHIRNLTPTRPILIMGDENIKFLPHTTNPQIQIEVFPNTKLADARRILCRGTPITPQVRKVILSFGLDNKSQGRTAILQKELQMLLRAAEKSFPNAEIFIPVVNFSRNLPFSTRKNIVALNHLIRRTPRPIPRLPKQDFQTETNGIQWTVSTAESMWLHWKGYLNIQDSTPAPMQEHEQITNLSSRRLTQAQIDLLSKGLSFVPTGGIPKGIRSQLAHNVSQYHRRLKLITHYGPNTDQLEHRLPFYPPSQWEPNWDDLPLELRSLIREDTHDTSNLILEPEKPNLTKEEEMALRQLRNDTSIVIKPADKGGRVVILDRIDYIREGYRQLNDTNYYMKLTIPIYQTTKEHITTILDNLQSTRLLNRKQIKYLKGDPQPRPRRFYLLPKIHKPPETWPIPYRIPSGRPIVSDCDSESYRTAEFIDFFLNPLSTKHDSYLRDTNHFIEKVKSIKIQGPCLLFSMDVESLYTNIDTSIGMKVIEQHLRKYPDPKRPDNQLLQLLYINLTRNDFQFNGEHFLQIRGTAMGKKFAPAYANIYMAHWEETVFPKCPLRPTQYLRYLDDIWGIWQHSQEEFGTFIDILNSHHPTIKLKATQHPTSIDFLDTTTFKGPQFLQTGRLDLRVFVKPTDTHALLHRRSFHPTHTFRGILKSQILRFRRICTRTTDYHKSVRRLFLALRRRGYSWSLMRRTKHNTSNDNPIGVKESSQQNKPPIPIVTTYSTYTKRATRKLKQNFNRILGQSTLFQQYRLISAFKKNPNLKDILVRTTLPPITARVRTPQQRIIRTATAGRVHRIPKQRSHTTSNCVYLLRCNSCQILYVGETQNSLRTRLTTHRHAIRNHPKRPTHVTAHFQRHGLTNFHASILEHDPHWSVGQRRRRENFWIRKLDTRFPKGLNQRVWI